MQNEKISLDAMPEMLAAIAQKLESIEAKVDNLTIPSNKEEKDEWLNLKGLCEHLPSHPAEQTVYGWTPSTIPFDYVRKSMLKYEINPLFAFLCGVMGEQETRRIFQLYRVGTGYKWGGCAVFWQTDINGQTRTGKLMAYDRTGHRVKEPTNTVSWSHSELKMTGYHLVQCLFGEHLLPSKPNTPVALVESEKTAVIMTHYMPNLLWLATGGKDGCFNENAMQRYRTAIMLRKRSTCSPLRKPFCAPLYAQPDCFQRNTGSTLRVMPTLMCARVTSLDSAQALPKNREGSDLSPPNPTAGVTLPRPPLRTSALRTRPRRIILPGLSRQKNCVNASSEIQKIRIT